MVKRFVYLLSPQTLSNFCVNWMPCLLKSAGRRCDLCMYPVICMVFIIKSILSIYPTFAWILSCEIFCEMLISLARNMNLLTYVVQSRCFWRETKSITVWWSPQHVAAVPERTWPSTRLLAPDCRRTQLLMCYSYVTNTPNLLWTSANSEYCPLLYLTLTQNCIYENWFMYYWVIDYNAIKLKRIF